MTTIPKNSIDGATILVTGGTGSFGQGLLKFLLRNFKPSKLIVFSRDELKQYEMQQDEELSAYSHCLRYFLGDVRDKSRLALALRMGVDIIVHAAALKHVPALEYNPFEAVKTNILGAQNVIEAAIEHNVKRVIALSTDKAAGPVNLYGASKLASDKLFVAGNHYSMGSSIFSVVRYGNVLGSRGSVVPFFLRQKKKGCITITNEKMTRFHITVSEGVQFLVQSLERMWGGEIFVPRIPSYRLIDLADAVAPDARKLIIGLRPGEKIHEEMITESDALQTAEFAKYFVIMPNTGYQWFDDKETYLAESSGTPGKMCEEGFKYSSGSNPHFLNVSELRNIIRNELPYAKQLMDGNAPTELTI